MTKRSYTHSHLRSPALIALILLCFAGAHPAAAADQTIAGLSYSTDGQHFTAHPPKLFDDLSKLVPGEGHEAYLWLRNNSERELNITVEPSRQPVETELDFVVISEPKRHLAPSEQTSFGLRVSLPRAATNQSFDQMIDLLTVKIHATEDWPGKEPSENPKAQPNENWKDHLGNTGFTDWLIPLAFGLVGVGLAVRRLTIRRTFQNSTAEGSQR